MLNELASDGARPPAATSQHEMLLELKVAGQAVTQAKPTGSCWSAHKNAKGSYHWRSKCDYSIKTTTSVGCSSPLTFSCVERLRAHLVRIVQ